MGCCCRCFGRNKKPTMNKDHHPVLDVRISNTSSSVTMNKSLEQESDIPVPKYSDHSKTESNAMIFSYRELATATKNFRQKFLIGEGGFGAVYKGVLERSGQIVAVKKLNHSGLQGDKEFLVEVLMLSLLRHQNLVNLIGYCAEGEQRLLVYEFMPLGSLEDHLHDLKPGMQPLDWNTRMKDLKSSNILLDQGFHPKLSDFGLAKFGPANDRSHVSTRVMGTRGYCALEYAGTGKLTMKSDIYSFGVVLLELITGRRPLDIARGNGKHSLVDWAGPIMKDRKSLVSLADPLLRGQFPECSLCRAMEMALMCIREDAHSRPSMKDVVHAMNFLTSRQYDPDADHDDGRDGSPAERQGQENERLNNPKDYLEETMLLDKKNKDRQLAVAEAKLWGETWRDKRRQGVLSDNDHSNR
ncbi:hypothetical protein OROHE_027249 [Orobanche hederae]